MCMELPLTFLLHLLHLLLQLHGAGEVLSLLGSMPMSSLVKIMNLLVKLLVLHHQLLLLAW